MKLPKNCLLMTLCHLIDEDKQQIILGEKLYGSSKGVIMGFGGKVDATDKNIKDAVIREVWEEAKVTIRQPKLKCILHFNDINGASQSGLAFVFLAHQWSGTPETTPEMKPIAFPLDKIPLNHMYANDRYWFNLIFSDQKAIVSLNRDRKMNLKDISIKFVTKLPAKFDRQIFASNNIS